MKKSELSVKPAEIAVLNVSTDGVNDVRKVLQHMGDSLCNKYNQTGDMKAAQSSIAAYAVAINAMKAQLIYKKGTASPARIDFFEQQ
jgi:hypothetical protein